MKPSKVRKVSLIMCLLAMFKGGSRFGSGDAYFNLLIEFKVTCKGQVIDCFLSTAKH